MVPDSGGAAAVALPGDRLVVSRWTRLLENQRVLATALLAPGVLILAVFIAYPFVMAIWFALTDISVGTAGKFVGIENFKKAWLDSIFQTAFWNTCFYTFWATVFKLALGMWLALLLNRHFRFKRMIRAWMLLPFIIPTVLSTFAWRWMFDPTFSVINWTLYHAGWITDRIPFLSDGDWAMWCAIVVNTWRGTPFFAITLLAGLQTISPSLYEAALLDGSTGWQRFRYITFPLLLPILAIVMTFSIIFTFTDFQLVYAITRGGPVNSTHLLATLAFQRGIPGGNLGEGAAIAVSMIPFLVFATLFSYFALARRKWQQGEAND